MNAVYILAGIGAFYSFIIAAVIGLAILDRWRRPWRYDK